MFKSHHFPVKLIPQRISVYLIVKISTHKRLIYIKMGDERECYSVFVL